VPAEHRTAAHTRQPSPLPPPGSLSEIAPGAIVRSVWSPSPRNLYLGRWWPAEIPGLARLVGDAADLVGRGRPARSRSHASYRIAVCGPGQPFGASGA
jgi:hypothetical protein